MYARVGHTLALLDRRDEALRAFELAAAAHSPRQFGWLGWRAVTDGKFEDARVHFTAMTKRDPAVSWQVGLALAQLALWRSSEAERQMEAALGRANPPELGEACRWIEYVARIAPESELEGRAVWLDVLRCKRQIVNWRESS